MKQIFLIASNVNVCCKCLNTEEEEIPKSNNYNCDRKDLLNWYIFKSDEDPENNFKAHSNRYFIKEDYYSIRKHHNFHNANSTEFKQHQEIRQPLKEKKHVTVTRSVSCSPVSSTGNIEGQRNSKNQRFFQQFSSDVSLEIFDSDFARYTFKLK